MNPQSQQPWQSPQPTPQTPPDPQAQPQPSPYGQPQPAPQQPQPTPQPNTYGQPHSDYQAPPQQVPPQNPPYAQSLEQDYSVDYLNQIAAPEKKSGPRDKLILIILILLGVLLVVAIAGMLLSGGSSNTLNKANELNARIETLTKISKDQHKHLRDNSLRATNTAFTLFLSNASSDLEAPLKAAGIEKKVTNSIKASEKTYESKLTADFEDARLNVVLDRTYARQMAYELDIINSMMRSIYNNTSNTELRGYLDNANNNLTPIAEDFRKFATAE